MLELAAPLLGLQLWSFEGDGRESLTREAADAAADAALLVVGAVVASARASPALVLVDVGRGEVVVPGEVSVCPVGVPRSPVFSLRLSMLSMSGWRPLSSSTTTLVSLLRCASEMAGCRVAMVKAAWQSVQNPWEPSGARGVAWKVHCSSTATAALPAAVLSAAISGMRSATVCSAESRPRSATRRLMREASFARASESASEAAEAAMTSWRAKCKKRASSGLRAFGIMHKKLSLSACGTSSSAELTV